MVHILSYRVLKMRKSRGSGDIEDRSDVLFTALYGCPWRPPGPPWMPPVAEIDQVSPTFELIVMTSVLRTDDIICTS